jgi:hypothetical protein
MRILLIGAPDVRGFFPRAEVDRSRSRPMRWVNENPRLPDFIRCFACEFLAEDFADLF